ncbi:DEKNAAC101298 [Brettanomyces naardenensis]|uniref:DEKNAAC101298 n=1 Tax=Brettanomyces naardenensis TaxID=13370 RepID=A0A448YHH6_BRENA|nr:DEKNAAC101298 [Brettanomyces naardenensis]
MQFEQCYQDNYEMIRLVSDSMLMSSVFYLVQIFVWATCIYSVHSVVRRLRQSKPGGSYKQRLDWLLVSAIVYDVAVLLTMVFAGLMHFYAVPFENYSVTYWLNVMEMCLTCFAYLYMFCILSLFIMTRVSFSFRFQSLVLIMLIIGFLILATALNMIWLIDAHENMKWLIGVYSLMQVIYVNLVYELLANWKMYDRNAETRGIVGREIPGGVAGSTPSKETTYVAQ